MCLPRLIRIQFQDTNSLIASLLISIRFPGLQRQIDLVEALEESCKYTLMLLHEYLVGEQQLPQFLV